MTVVEVVAVEAVAAREDHIVAAAIGQFARRQYVRALILDFRFRDELEVAGVHRERTGWRLVLDGHAEAPLAGEEAKVSARHIAVKLGQPAGEPAGCPAKPAGDELQVWPAGAWQQRAFPLQHVPQRTRPSRVGPKLSDDLFKGIAIQSGLSLDGGRRDA